MKIEEIENNPNYKVIERNPDYLVVYSNRFETKTKVLLSALEKLTVNEFEIKTHQGRNVEHITRVTGYFSKVSGWNKGKVAELVDRYRTPVE